MNDGYVKIGHIGERNDCGVFAGGVDLFVRADEVAGDHLEKLIRNAGEMFAEILRKNPAMLNGNMTR